MNTQTKLRWKIAVMFNTLQSKNTLTPNSWSHVIENCTCKMLVLKLSYPIMTSDKKEAQNQNARIFLKLEVQKYLKWLIPVLPRKDST